MLNIKKTAAAVLALSSSAVFAGTMGPVCSAVNVTVPCESTAWDVGARALYLQATTAGAGYSYAGVDNQNRGIAEDQWGWGFMIEGSYHYETGSDSNLNWYHFSKSNRRSFATTSNNTTASNLLGFGPTVTESSSLSSVADFDPKWDAVNLEFGQHVDFGEKKSIRFHAGVQYARLAVTAKASTTGSASITEGGTTTTLNNISSVIQFKPTYNGFGPRVGADMGYAWGNGLSVYGNGALALLAGSSKVSVSQTTTIAGVTPMNLSGSKATVVPELEAKLGIKYDYSVAQGDLTLDAGWMWVNYFNAVQSTTATGPGPLTSSTQEGDFGLQGLYFGLKWMGNVA